MSGGRIDY